jgi:hypothetical protein
MSVKPQRVRPLCGKCSAGWIYSEPADGTLDPTVERCPCRTAPSPEERVDEALRAVADAHRDSFTRAKDIIRDTARRLNEFSSNETRYAMQLAQVPSGVVGAAFSAVTREGLIEHTGQFVMSEDDKTRHRVGVYRSLVFIPDAKAQAAS